MCSLPSDFEALYGVHISQSYEPDRRGARERNPEPLRSIMRPGTCFCLPAAIERCARGALTMTAQLPTSPLRRFLTSYQRAA